MRYTKKPITIDAIQFTGENGHDIIEFVGTDNISSVTLPAGGTPHNIAIATLEGVMSVSHGDYVIKGIKGEFYPCKPDIFEMTYEVEE